MVAVVDDLIILGIIAAATIASSQVSAHTQESNAQDEATRRKQFQERQAKMDFWRNRAAQFGADTSFMEGHQRQMGIDAGYDGAMEAASRQADATRLNGYLQAGTTVASGLANSAMRPAQTAVGRGLGGAAGMAQRAQSYDLNPGDYQLLSGAGEYSPSNAAPITPTDPNGGFQLQEQNYQLLGGAGPYAHGPYDDDPYAVGVGFVNPRQNRYRL
jgi:hypothetical protein